MNHCNNAWIHTSNVHQGEDLLSVVISVTIQLQTEDHRATLLFVLICTVYIYNKTLSTIFVTNIPKLI